MKILRTNNLTLTDRKDVEQLMGGRVKPSRFRDGVVATLVVDPPKQKPWYEGYGEKRILSLETYSKVKRLVDVVLSILALPFVLPILAICSIAIIIDSPGKVFFFQK